MWIELTSLGTSNFPIETLAGALNYGVAAPAIVVVIATTVTAVGIEKAVDIVIDTIR